MATGQSGPMTSRHKTKTQVMTFSGGSCSYKTTSLDVGVTARKVDWTIFHLEVGHLLVAKATNEIFILFLPCLNIRYDPYL